MPADTGDNGETNMELKLDRKEIEAILLVHVCGLVPEAAINRIEWDSGYNTVRGATFDHTDLPPEIADE